MNICPICKKLFKQITVQHIRKHDITVEDFKKQFPDVVLGNINAVRVTKEAAIKRAENDNIRCMQCGVLITAFDRKIRRFCSHNCSAIYYNLKKEKIKRICPICGKILTTKQSYTNNACCSKQCSVIYKNNDLVNQWLEGKINGSCDDINHTIRVFVRKFLFEKNKNRCERCGWGEKNEFTGLIPLQIHHKDGDSTNSCLTNLELLCPNCHSLTENYGAKNKGNGKRKTKAA